MYYHSAKWPGLVKNKRIKVESGNWWTSTQYSATNAVNLNNGGWNNNNKTTNYSVVPFLAYQTRW